jgi:hypothetical protein
MTTNEISDNLRDKSFHKTATDIRKRTEVQQLNLETQWTDYIQNQVDFGNKHYLRNFSLRLEMEVNDDQCAYQNYRTGGF